MLTTAFLSVFLGLPLAGNMEVAEPPDILELLPKPREILSSQLPQPGTLNSPPMLHGKPILMLPPGAIIDPWGDVILGPFQPSAYEHWQYREAGLENQMKLRVYLDPVQPYYLYNGKAYRYAPVSSHFQKP